MIAQFDGQDYFVYLDKSPDNLELRKVTLCPLEANLEMKYNYSGFPKKLVLQSQETNHPDGIEVSYFPPGAESWADIQEIRVSISSRARVNLSKFGVVGTRYNGSDNIEIMDGFPNF